MTTYDRIGQGYARTRQPDPHIAAQIERALGDAATVLNAGAGTGSYESAGRRVVALEPSIEMIRQRAPDAAPVVRADATAMPFGDDAFDAATAVLTIHHWPDQAAGLAEMRRVSRRRIVILTHDTDRLEGFWLTRDYFPSVEIIDRPRFPTTERLSELLDIESVEVVPVPRDCRDGFLAAYWARPEAYLDPGIRAGISFFPMADPSVVSEGLARLERDLASGEWGRRNTDILGRDAMDYGYRLVVAAP